MSYNYYAYHDIISYIRWRHRRQRDLVTKRPGKDSDMLRCIVAYSIKEQRTASFEIWNIDFTVSCGGCLETGWQIIGYRYQCSGRISAEIDTPWRSGNIQVLVRQRLYPSQPVFTHIYYTQRVLFRKWDHISFFDGAVHVESVFVTIGFHNWETIISAFLKYDWVLSKLKEAERLAPCLHLDLLTHATLHLGMYGLCLFYEMLQWEATKGILNCVTYFM